ncbi:hypothetical protein ACJMK2_039584 [Sinanodonta woodiana]|uniref:C1q domain-containing protein n=1 Tax=Sinanodonta woodiana TaxID=1069815 RepID=A0ABD3WEF8_SINWO
MIFIYSSAQVVVESLVVNHADNPTELLELVRKMSIELLSTKEELQETRQQLLTSTAELLQSQNKLISSQSELQNRIKDLEDEVKHFKIKDQARRSVPLDVGFTARLSHTLASGLQRQQTLVFDNVYINVGNGYDATTGVFRAPVAGMYIILMTVSGVGGYQSDDVEVVHNGVTVCCAVAPHGNYGGCPCNAIVHLNVGDTVWIRGIYDRPDDRIFGDYYTTFSMGLMLKGDDGGSSF